MTDDITKELAEIVRRFRLYTDSNTSATSAFMVRVDAALELYEHSCKPKMTINLKDYEGKFVVVTLRNEWRIVSNVYTNDGYSYYPYSIDGKNYFNDGRIFSYEESPYDIIDIKLVYEDPEPSMIDMCGGSTPIVPEETIDEWKKVGLIAETNKQTAPDIIEINGVKYQRVDEQEPETLTLKNLLKKWEFDFNAKWENPKNRTSELYEEEVERFIQMFEEWMPDAIGVVGDDDWDDGYNSYRDALMEKLK
jgi:hypothetical protein